MDYHQDRFEDYSLMIYEDEKLVALLPANTSNNKIYSHQGLTFGSLLLNNKVRPNDVVLFYQTLVEFFYEQGISEIEVKQIPEIYFKEPAFEQDYFLSQNYLSSVKKVLAIDYSKPLQIHKTKLKHYRKSSEFNFKINEHNDFGPFWEQVLEPRLLEKHDAKPVHCLDEIKLLNKRFPNNIKQFDVCVDNRLLAGITIFETETIVKSQYGATTKEGEKFRALDYLFLYLIYKYKEQGKRFFSMGTVSNTSEIGYSQGLLKQKEELGCDVYSQNIFTIPLND